MKQTIEKVGNKTVYNLYFSNLTDLYDYVKSDPPVNRNVFSQQFSLSNNANFAGAPLSDSIEYIMGGYTKDLNNFLDMVGSLNKDYGQQMEIRTLKKGLFGGVPLAPLVAAGVPDCMLRYEIDASPRSINIYYNLFYSWCNGPEQIFNRGVSTLYLIQELQNKNYIVNFNAIALVTSDERDEIVNMVITLKRPEDLFLNIEKCYFPMVGKEFTRRVLFRVLESVPVQNISWGYGYGSNVSENVIADFYGLKKNEIIIAQPTDMEIKGSSIYEDTISLIEKLNLEKEFNVEKMKQKVKCKR